MAGFGKLTFAQKKCVGTVGMLMQKTAMAGPGARIGVAVSGGVDSFALIKTLTMLGIGQRPRQTSCHWAD